MFPLRDGVARRYPAVVTGGLIVVNTLVLFFQSSLSPDALERFLAAYALIPARYFSDHPLVGTAENLSDYLPFLTSMFLHGGWLHLILNMWTLWIFGPAVEDRLGSVRYFGFYLVCGVAAAYAHAVLNADSLVPTLGASGAIAGIIGCYVRLFPRARLVMMIPLGFIPFFFEVEAVFFAFFWFLTQILPGIFSLMVPETEGGIAWWAHIGGFLAGWILLPLIRRRPRHYRRYYADEGRYGFYPNGYRSRGGRPWE